MKLNGGGGKILSRIKLTYYIQTEEKGCKSEQKLSAYSNTLKRHRKVTINTS